MGRHADIVKLVIAIKDLISRIGQFYPYKNGKESPHQPSYDSKEKVKCTYIFMVGGKDSTINSVG